MKKETACEKYNEIVKRNIENNLKEEDYKDSDKYFSEIIKPIICIEGNAEIEIVMSSDGVCGIKKIKKFSYGKELIEKYRLLREDMFNCLQWPIHQMSINQMRGFVRIFNDRVDLLLRDIQEFYGIVENATFSSEIINKIKNNCRLYRAYLNMETFAWLCSFKNFDDFIKRRNLTAFVDYDVFERKYIARVWTKEDSNEFSKEYFDRLCERVKKYKGMLNSFEASV